MQSQPLRPNMAMALIAFTVLFGIMLACARAIQTDNAAFWSVSSQGLGLLTTPLVGAQNPGANPRAPGEPVQTPTPDDPHPLPVIRSEVEQYVVQANDSLMQIAKRYGISLEQLVQANNLENPDLVEVGQVLSIPIPLPEGAGPSFKIIPDSELVYGPASATFDLNGFVSSQVGFLASYQEEVDGQTLNGAQVIARVSQDYSVNPRLLLAVVEYQSGWITKPDPNQGKQEYPLGLRDPSKQGLYRQLAWAANQLNRGFYIWRVNGTATWLLADGETVPIAPTINAGTAGVQHFFSTLYDRESWVQAVSEGGLFETFNGLFGFPFDYAVEPLQPPDLTQPQLQLPIEPGEKWAFTGGPHGGWGDGSAWAALDFAPPGEALGCVQSDAWVVAAADGLIVRTGNGAVIQDLDGDGFEQTGWVLNYMHIETRDRVEVGTYLKAGERIGHPSCEGGYSTGTHTHFSRRYNGEWIPADQNLPFVLDGWSSRGDGYEYNGYLERDGESIEAYAGRSGSNGIQR
jgi:murein DD-endopeptidase MepM/ murein hydrolase activator NlpD